MSLVIVDVESDGPIPAEYSMVCFGAVLFDDPGRSFRMTTISTPVTVSLRTSSYDSATFAFLSGLIGTPGPAAP